MLRKLLPFVVLLMLVSMLPAAGCGDSASSPEGTVKAFMEAWAKQDYQTMAKLSGERYEDFEEDASYDDDDIIKSYKIGKTETVNSSEVRVWCNVVFPDDYYGEMSMDFIFMVVKSGNQWVLDLDRIEVDWGSENFDNY